jgi:hypothetical protein
MWEMSKKAIPLLVADDGRHRLPTSTPFTERGR